MDEQRAAPDAPEDPPASIRRAARNSGVRAYWSLRPHVFVPDKTSGTSSGGFEDPNHPIWSHEYENCLACGELDSITRVQCRPMHTRGAIDIERGGMIALPALPHPPALE